MIQSLDRYRTVQSRERISNDVVWTFLGNPSVSGLNFKKLGALLVTGVEYLPAHQNFCQHGQKRTFGDF